MHLKRVTNAQTPTQATLLEQPRYKSSVEPAARVSFLLGGRLVGEECCFFPVDLVLASVEVGILGVDTLGLVPELVSENQDKV